jgi:large subunit GTPase 1
MQLLW